MKVSDVMVRDISAIFEEETVEHFIRMAAFQLRFIFPVVDEQMRIIGVISEDDIVNATLPSYFGMLQTTSFIPDTNQMKRKLTDIRHEGIASYVNRSVVTVSENDTVLHAADLLLRKRIFSLFVVNEEEKLTGYVNRSRILLGVLEEINGEKNGL